MLAGKFYLFRDSRGRPLPVASERRAAGVMQWRETAICLRGKTR